MMRATAIVLALCAASCPTAPSRYAAAPTLDVRGDVAFTDPERMEGVVMHELLHMVGLQDLDRGAVMSPTPHTATVLSDVDLDEMARVLCPQER
jgi:hypothetical protein